MAKKKYENIFAKMAEHHNNDIVPILRNLNLKTVKVRNQRILKLRDQLEIEEDVLLSIDLFTEYITTNSFVVKFIEKDALVNSYELIKTKSKDNVFIGINCLYTLIEDKKSELIEKFK